MKPSAQPHIIFVDGHPASKALLSRIKEAYNGSRRDLVEKQDKSGSKSVFPEVRSKAVADRVVATLTGLGYDVVSARPGRFSATG